MRKNTKYLSPSFEALTLSAEDICALSGAQAGDGEAVDFLEWVRE